MPFSDREIAAAPREVDFAAVADLCTQFGRVETTGDLQARLREAAAILDATGLATALMGDMPHERLGIANAMRLMLQQSGFVVGTAVGEAGVDLGVGERPRGMSAGRRREGDARHRPRLRARSAKR